MPIRVISSMFELVVEPAVEPRYAPLCYVTVCNSPAAKPELHNAESNTNKAANKAMQAITSHLHMPQLDHHVDCSHDKSQR